MTATTAAAATPFATDLDLFSDEVLLDPFPHYRTLRDLGPAAYLTRYDLWALTRYDQVRAALADWRTFSSAQGPGLNDIINTAWTGAVISTDPPHHAALRRVFSDRLRPKEIRTVAGDIERRAEDLIDQLVARQTFDAVADLARALPVQLVMDLIGWPAEGRDRLLEWAEGSFNAAGPRNDRMFAALPKLEALFTFLVQVATPENLLPGSFGRTIYEAAERGEIDVANCVPLLAGYATAALDTTINAMGNAVLLFVQNPDQWRAVHEEASLVPSAFTEVLRIDGPVQFFSRVLTRDVDLDGVGIPGGSRVLHSYGAANRDERHYPDPDRFDVRRNPTDHLGFGHGPHMCAGSTLATMEAHALLTALAARVERVELAGEPVRLANNITRGLDALPVRVHAAR
jgi:cytochrome P450